MTNNTSALENIIPEDVVVNTQESVLTDVEDELPEADIAKKSKACKSNGEGQQLVPLPMVEDQRKMQQEQGRRRSERLV